MAIVSGLLEVATPTAGSAFTVGSTVHVSGSTESGENTKNGAELPATSVTVRLDGGVAQVATQLVPDWLGWETDVQLTTPGPHTITVVARRASGPTTNVWSKTKTIAISAITPLLNVVGVERTQATQFFLSNGQGSGNGANNSVPLVAEKPTVFRVYVHRVSPPGQPGPATVTGSLSVSGSAPLLPSNGPIVATSSNVIDRGNIDHTLDF